MWPYGPNVDYSVKWLTDNLDAKAMAASGANSYFRKENRICRSRTRYRVQQEKAQIIQQIDENQQRQLAMRMSRLPLTLKEAEIREIGLRWAPPKSQPLKVEHCPEENGGG